ncbi:G-type lectin S-receptor-like serine/threonine-protein kinase B120 [Vitis vinifera]|uniref:G-type lectin S-receptor-like serine/threonine-protein kinase B120 n=1 Tax=Vitis vinifera TaxID=29760 RepID=A0A438G9V2_VITVI|nr:G-type lectin S-receptor-like serine/threonine-protein kinase B120 [Vitis vinifera]
MVKISSCTSIGARYSSIATTQCCRIFLRECCRIFLEDILKGKSVERRFRLTSRWATGFHLQFVDAFTDTILQGQSLITSQTIISAGGNFELGFFSPGKSTKYYVGIWYKKISEQTIVWVANRDYPFTNPSVVLTVSTDGNLEILEGKFSYKVTSISSSSNTSATLLDSGNLVLRNKKSDVLWESFDYPSDTLLPGMKLGYDKRAGKTWSMVSWKSAEDPSPGDFSLQVDPNGTSQIFSQQGPNRYWTSGVWDGQIFGQVPEMRFFYMYKYKTSFNENESYFTYSLNNPSILSRVVLDVLGQIRHLNCQEGTHEWDLSWLHPRTQCEVYVYCGPFGICTGDSVEFCECLTGFEPRFLEDWNLQDRSGGCVRKADLECVNESHANGERDQFLLVSNVRLPKYPVTIQARSAVECESICLNSCPCSAYAYEGDECRIWGGDLVNVEKLPDGDSNARSFYIKLAASELNKRGSEEKVSISHGQKDSQAVQQFLGEDLLVFDFGNSSEDTSYELGETNRLWRGEKKEADLPRFSFASASASTNNFSIENKLGEGGFGSVYKGKSQRGYEVAVKRLSKRSKQGWEELKNEVMLIAKLQHKNLVRVLGYCTERDEKILIYEYMSNKSLDFFLFDPVKRGILNWETRVHIIEGASNILLDKDMNPKISDFGMARIFGGNKSKATKHIVGTYGYMSPEYALEGLFSTKSDVFSFGVLLLEILSGKKNTGFYQTDSLNLLGYAWDLWKDSRGQELMDPGLEETLPTHILLRYINVGLLCVQESADDRPTMSDVVSMLDNESTHKSLSSNPDLEQYLTSWKCTDDPSTRNFTWRLDIPRLPQLAVGMGSVKKYRTGPWNGAGNYSANLRVTINHLGLLQWNILNESNDEWTTMLSSMPVCECLKGFTPNSKGEWEMFDWSSGCERAGTLDCKSKDDLMKVLGVKLPDLLEFWLNKSMSLKECETECLKNCSCVAYANSNIKGGSSGCLTWYGDLIDIGGFTDGKSGQDLYIRCPAGELGSIHGSNKKKKLVAGLVASTISGMLILGLVFCNEVGTISSIGLESEMEDLELPLFDLATIDTATNNFCVINRIGTGSFGPVFKIKTEERYCHGKSALTLLWGSCKDLFISTKILDFKSFTGISRQAIYC